MYFLFWKIFFNIGICISKPALEMTLYITTRGMILWVGLGCTVSWDRNGLPEFQIFMGLIHESLVEDILHSCHFWRSQTFALCLKRAGWFWSLFFCQVMFYQWLVLPPLWPQRFRGDISPVFFQKRSHDFKDHFFFSRWCINSLLISCGKAGWQLDISPIFGEAKGWKTSFWSLCQLDDFEVSNGKKIPSLIIASFKLDLKIVNP